MKVIGLSGKAQHGKTTVMNMVAIINKEEKLGLRIRYTNFADLLKQSVSMIFNVSLPDLYSTDGKEKEHPDIHLKNREILQKFGTEVCRNVHPDTWVFGVKNEIAKYKQSGDIDIVFIGDMRFVNEYNMIHEHEDGLTIRVVREKFGTISESQHESEIALDHITDWDYVFKAKNLDELKQNIVEFMKKEKLW